jgi:hypothetical protein
MSMGSGVGFANRNFIVSPIKFRRLRLARHLARMAEGTKAFKIFISKPTGRGTVGNFRLRWEEDVRIDLK